MNAVRFFNSLLVLLTMTLSCSIYFYYNKSKECKRLEIQNKIAEGEVVTYKNNEGHWVSTLQDKELDINRLNDDISALKAIKETGVKLRQISSISTNVIESHDTIYSRLKHDTTYVFIDGIKELDSVRKLDYKDKFYEVNAVIFKNDSITINIKSLDSITQVVKRYKEGFFLFKPLKKWKYQQFVYSENPNNKIKFSEYINVINFWGNKK